MDKKQLKHFSKSRLIEIILNLEERLKQLEQFVRAFDNPHTPSSKQRSKKNTVHDEESRFPGKPKGSNGAGIDMPAPDKEERVTKSDCPECGKNLGKPYDTYKFRQMDIPEPKNCLMTFIICRFLMLQYLTN